MPDDLGNYDAEVRKRMSELNLNGIFEKTNATRSDGPYRDNIASLYGKRSQLLDELKQTEEMIREREAMIIPHITSGPSRLDGWLHKLGWKLIKRYRPYKYDCPD